MTEETKRAFDKALVERTHFEKVALWLPQLAVHYFNAGLPVIKDKIFTDCLIEGPAVLFAVDKVSFDGCNMGFAEDPRSLLIQPVGPKVTGVIPFENTTFRNCRFAMIGFMSDRPFMEQFPEMVKTGRMAGGGQA